MAQDPRALMQKVDSHPPTTNTITKGSFCRQKKQPKAQAAASVSSAAGRRNGRTQRISTHRQPTPSGCKS